MHSCIEAWIQFLISFVGGSIIGGTIVVLMTWYFLIAPNIKYKR